MSTKQDIQVNFSKFLKWWILLGSFGEMFGLLGFGFAWRRPDDWMVIVFSNSLIFICLVIASAVSALIFMSRSLEPNIKIILMLVALFVGAMASVAAGVQLFQLLLWLSKNV